MPPKPKTPAVPEAQENALVTALDQKNVALANTVEKLGRLTSAQAALSGERRLLSTQLRDERTQFGDISSHLQHALDEQTARADGLQARLAEAQAAARAAEAAAQQAAAAAEQRHAADEAGLRARLVEQREQVQAAEAALAERAALKEREEQLTAKMGAAAAAHQKHQLELERKHAGDREAWRRDTQAAVAAARQEVAALTDQRLDDTTQRTILDNESITSELQYQGRYVQGLLSRNEALAAEAEEARLALAISRCSEQELARKALACERLADSLMARLAAVEAQRAEDEQALRDEREQVHDARDEAKALKLKMEDQQRKIEELEAGLAGKRRELKQVKTAQNDAAGFLVKCLADVRQELLAGKERAVLAAAAAVNCTSTQPQLPQQHVAKESSGRAGGFASSPGAVPSAEASAAPSVMAELSVQQRQATLQRLLQLMRPDWQESEGLALALSSSPSTSSLGLLGEGSSSGWSSRALPSQHSPSTRSLAGREQACRPGRQPGCGLQVALSTSCSSSGGCLAGEDKAAAGACKPGREGGAASPRCGARRG